jgi:hypothetical protein
MKKAYFQYYETFETIVEKFTDPLQRESFRKKIIDYGLHGIEPEIKDPLEDMAWTVCKELIDQQLHRREVNRANRLGKQKEERPAEERPETPKPAEEKAPRTERPTLEEIKAFCKEKNYKINAEQFFNYYESNGWKVGRNSMKSWRAAVVNWATRDRKSGTLWAGNSTDAQTEEYADYF